MTSSTKYLGLTICSLVVAAMALTACASPDTGPVNITMVSAATPVIESTATKAPATSVPTASPTTAPTATATASPTPSIVGANWDKVKPNELGRIMILEYHMIGLEEDRWTRSYKNFWHDLETLYAKGYRPIGLNELIDNKIDVPAGYSPVVLTFDDSSPMQFAYITGPGGGPVVDPNSAVGMLERFHQLHPDFPLKATFFVLPAADPPHDFFGQDEFKERKLRYLVSRGFELGNHTFWHQRLDTLASREAVAEQLGKSVAEITRIVPDYEVRALALPLGLFPAREEWAYSGSYKGTDYENELILLATGGTTPPPNHVEFDPYMVPRIQATNLELDFEEAYIGYYDAHPEARYVSDGDPDVIAFPAALQSKLKPSEKYRAVSLPPSAASTYRGVRIR